MKGLITVFLLALPAAAQAMGGEGGGAGCGGSCGQAVAAVYAILAALGYWVMHTACKETSNCVKKIGHVVGSVLVIIGLLGLLCGVGSHIKKSMKSCGGKCGSEMGQSGNATDNASMMQHGQMKSAKTK